MPAKWMSNRTSLGPTSRRVIVVLVSGSVAEVPRELLALLKVGGRLGAIVGAEPVMRATLITRVDEHAFAHTQAWDTVAPRLLNFPEPSGFSF